MPRKAMCWLKPEGRDELHRILEAFFNGQIQKESCDNGQRTKIRKTEFELLAHMSRDLIYNIFAAGRYQREKISIDKRILFGKDVFNRFLVMLNKIDIETETIIDKENNEYKLISDSTYFSDDYDTSVLQNSIIEINSGQDEIDIARDAVRNIPDNHRFYGSQSCCSTQQSFLSLLLKELGISLTSFDCSQQKNIFRMVDGICVRQNYLAKSYIIKSDPRLHNWLICSLLKDIRNWMNAEIWMFSASKYLSGQLVPSFWEDLYYDCMRKPRTEILPSQDFILNELAQLVQTKSIYIRVDRLDGNGVRKLALEDLNNQFWVPLQSKLSGCSLPTTRGITLILTASMNSTIVNSLGCETYEIVDDSRHNAPLDLTIIQVNRHQHCKPFPLSNLRREILPDNISQCPIEITLNSSVNPDEIRTWLVDEEFSRLTNRQGSLDSEEIPGVVKQITGLGNNDFVSCLSGICEVFGHDFESLVDDTCWETPA